jgi:peptidoglycan hydrolase-like protein with peptidoglycan-binding domain
MRDNTKMRCAKLKASKLFFAISLATLLSLFAAPSLQASTGEPEHSNPQAASSGSPSARSTSPAAKKKSKKRRSRREPSQKVPTPQRISEIQSALARGGYYQGPPNGKWDANTVAAMQKFQSGNGLEPSGKLNAVSLQKLGLGSEIAGVSAPKPVAPAATPAATGPSAAPTHPPSPPPSSTSNSAAAAKPPSR